MILLTFLMVLETGELNKMALSLHYLGLPLVTIHSETPFTGESLISVPSEFSHTSASIIFNICNGELNLCVPLVIVIVQPSLRALFEIWQIKLRKQTSLHDFRRQACVKHSANTRKPISGNQATALGSIPTARQNTHSKQLAAKSKISERGKSAGPTALVATTTTKPTVATRRPAATSKPKIRASGTKDIETEPHLSYRSMLQGYLP
jgi:hypothetical protein